MRGTSLTGMPEHSVDAVVERAADVPRPSVAAMSTSQSVRSVPSAPDAGVVATGAPRRAEATAAAFSAPAATTQTSRAAWMAS